MSLPSLAVRRPIATTMVYLAVVVLGAIAFARFRIDLLPDVSLPTLTVYTTYPGVGPLEVERFITEPIERAVARVPGVERVSSLSTEGASRVTIRFGWGTDMDYATLNVRGWLDNVRYELPATAGRPTILRTDPGSEPIVALAATGPELARLKNLAEDVLRRRLEQIDGIAQATVVGGLEREIHVELDPRRLEMYGVTVPEVARTLALANYSARGGTVRRGEFRYALRTLGEFRTLEEIGTTVAKRGPGGARVWLRDVANIVDGFAEREMIARYNGRESIGLLAFKEAGANTVRVTRRAEQVLDQLRVEYPAVEIQVAFAQAEFIAEAIENVVQALVYGALLAFLVLFLFLHDLRYPVVIALSIPLSVAVAFALLHALGVSLNIMSLGGLALGVGMLVDNSIVVLENVFRRREEGTPAAEAAVTGAEEVQLATTAATLTTIAVFLPIVYVRGVAGELLEDLSLAVSLSLLASLAVALTLLPVLAARLGSVGRAGDVTARRVLVVTRSFKATERGYQRFARGYQVLLRRCLDRKQTVCAVAAGSLVVSVILGRVLRRDLLPTLDEGQFQVRLGLPLGTPLEETDRIAGSLEERLQADPDVRTVFTRVGRARGVEVAEAGAAGVNAAVLDVRLREGASTPAAVRRFRGSLPPLPPDAVAIETGRSTALGRALGLAQADLAIRIRGPDLNAMAALAQEARRRLVGVPQLANIRVGSLAARSELRIELDRERVARHGLAVKEVADVVQALVHGTVPTQFVDFTEKVDIVVRAPKTARRDLEALFGFALNGVPLRELVSVREALAPVEVLRDGQDRVVPVYADVARGGLGDAIAAAREALADLALPAGLRVEIGGESEEMRESFRSLLFAFGLALFLMYLILAAQFESLVHPLIILCSVPLAGIGAVVALVLAGHGLNAMSLIGVVILVGIVVNNAIVEVDLMNRARRAGNSLRDAVLEAARVRLRPILMTAITTALGLLPMALGVGAGADLRAPLALAVIGGLVSSTLLTVVVVPTAYEGIEEIREWLRHPPVRGRVGERESSAGAGTNVGHG